VVGEGGERRVASSYAKKYGPYPASRNIVAVSPRYSPGTPCCLYIVRTTSLVDGKPVADVIVCCLILISSVGVVIVDAIMPVKAPAMATCASVGVWARDGLCKRKKYPYPPNTSPFSGARVTMGDVMPLNSPTTRSLRTIFPNVLITPPVYLRAVSGFYVCTLIVSNG